MTAPPLGMTSDAWRALVDAVRTAPGRDYLSHGATLWHGDDLEDGVMLHAFRSRTMYCGEPTAMPDGVGFALRMRAPDGRLAEFSRCMDVHLIARADERLERLLAMELASLHSGTKAFIASEAQSGEPDA